MSCDDVQAALAPLYVCTETPDGARVATHCLYPSFDPVNVYVVRLGDGFRVHDGGGAERASWLHGRDDRLITKMLNRYADRYDLKLSGGILTAEAHSPEWLLSAMLAVANASAAAANAVVEHVVAAVENELTDRVYEVLRKTVGEPPIAREFSFVGKSGKEHHFDFAVRRGERAPILIDTVTPHHVSIAHKYVAFADVAADGREDLDRFAVYDKPLHSDDAALMRQVADLLPFASLEPGTRKAFSRWQTK